jgi:hypothetical protein
VDGRPKGPRLPGLLDPSWPSSWAGVRLPSCSEQQVGSRTPLGPIRSLLGLGSRAHHQPAVEYVSMYLCERWRCVGATMTRLGTMA